MQFSQYRLVINQTWFDATLVYKSLSAQCPKMRWKFVEPFEFNRALQFTVEREKNTCLSFLDLIIKLTDQENDGGCTFNHNALPP